MDSEGYRRLSSRDRGKRSSGGEIVGFGDDNEGVGAK